MKLKRILLIIFVSLLLITTSIFQLYLSKIDSQTTDEAIHLTSGYTYLTKGDFRFNPEHPPLLKMIAALPLLSLRLNLPSDELYYSKAFEFYYDSWREARSYGEDFMYALGNDADLILLYGRVPMILLTLILGFTIFYISSRLWGVSGGILSLVLFALEPIVLAHGHLITTDIGVSIGYILGIFWLWQFLKQPKIKNILLLGLILGLSQLMKFSAVIMIPSALILVLYYSLAYKLGFNGFIKRFGKFLVSLVVAFLVIWAGYFFDTNPIPLDKPTNLAAGQVQTSGVFERFKKFLIPRDYFKGLNMVYEHTKIGHDSFLLGENSKTGWWYYFPTLFVAKTTLPLLVLFLFSLVFILTQPQHRRTGGFFLIALLLFFGFAMKSNANLGIRHIMPVYSILFILIGAGASYIFSKKIFRALFILLLGWLVLENYLVFPNYLSYYNQIFGGTKNGYKVANDSNYDWGQDLKRIKAYLGEHPEISDPLIEYPWNSMKAVSYYKINARNAKDYDKELPKGYLIIGATSLKKEPYDSLQNLTFYDRITPSVFVYKIN